MGNVNMPTPVALAGAGLCLLAGYLVGAFAHPSGQDQSTAQVRSFDPATNRICLVGDAVGDLANAADDALCGTWRHDPGSTEPSPGDDFRFVSMTSNRSGDDESATFIFGEVSP